MTSHYHMPRITVTANRGMFFQAAGLKSRFAVAAGDLTGCLHDNQRPGPVTRVILNAARATG